MTDNNLPGTPPPGPPDIVELNLERLLGKAYKPEAPDPEFVQRVRDRLAAAARERAPSLPMPRRWPSPSRRALGMLALAAALAGLAFLLHALTAPPPRESAPERPFVKQDQPKDEQAAPHAGDRADPERLDRPQVADTAAPPRADYLAPRPRPEAPAVKTLAVGQSLRTASGERRRVALPDGSVLYLNQKTEVKLEAERRLTLSAGEVFLEVAPRPAEGGEACRFVIKTPRREVVALGTKFDVAAHGVGTGVTVTQGKVRVSDLDGVLTAGQQLAPDARQPSTAPRAAAALAWTRELMCAAEAPLVPPSKYAGGAIVVNDPSGQQSQLSLRKYHIDVHIEDGFARTTIDQTYFNHTMSRLEGTFYFPLPPDASLSRLAMYVNGQLMEGGMAERDFARQTFDNIVRRMKDPALLEWVDGSTFKMRVFPLEARQEKRIVLSYTQRLPVQYGRTPYRFPAGHSLETVRDWSFHARVKGGKGLSWASDTHPDLLKATTEKGDLLLDARQQDVKVEGDVALDLFDGGKQPRGDESARFSSMDHEGARYFMVRYRPDLPAARERRHRDWVFLFESSAERDPLLARTQIEVIRALLSNAEHDDTFAVVTAATHAGTFADEARPVTPENVAAAMQYLEETHLVGMLDLGKALAAARPFLKAARNPYLVHVGSGLPVLGETKADMLARLLSDGAHYVGVGVGKRWNRALMKQAAERSGGFFTQINPDEPITWRAFELYSALTAPRLLDVKVIDDSEKVTFLTHTSTVAQGEEVCAIARLEAGAKLPTSVTVTGTLDGKTFSRPVPVKNVAANAGYLPRTWAKLEIERLLAENAQANKARIVQLSRASYVMTPFTSLLVLENEQMYQQYGVDRGRKDHWAMYPCPETIPVLPAEPLDGVSPVAKAGPAVKPGAEDILGTILYRVPPQVFADGAANLPRAVTVRDLYAGAFAVPLSVALDHDISKGQIFNFYLGYDRPIDRLPMTDMAQKLRAEDEKKANPNGPVAMGGPGPASWSGGMPGQPPRTAGPAEGPPPVPGGAQPGLGGGFPGGGMMPPGGFGGGGGFGPGQFGGGFGSGSFNGGFAGLGGGLGGMGGFSGMGTYTPPPAGGSGSAMSRPVGGPQAPFGSGQLNYAPMFVYPNQQWQLPSGATVNPYAGYYLMPSQQQAGQAPRMYAPANVTKATERGAKDLAAGVNGMDESTMIHRQLTAEDLVRMRRLLDQLEEPATLEKRRANGAEGEPRKGTLRQAVDDGLLLRQAGGGYVPGWMAPRAALWALPGGARPEALLYRLPTFAPDGRFFTDLVAFAPGLNTNFADVLGVLEVEAAPESAAAPGTIEPAARALIDGARAAGWRTLTVPAAGGAPAWSVSFDGSGRYAAERVLACGLTEHVVCDGKELLHLYPELGLGARRKLTRFHRAELTDLVPWALPPAKDLAHGFDLKCAGERTVVLTPHGLKAGQAATLMHLVFGEDGRLQERRLVRVPENKVLGRETYGADGTVKLLDANDKVLSERKLALKPGGAADLDPDTKDLLVLPMPLRTREHVVAQPGAAGGNVASMDRPSWLALLAADSATGSAAWLENSTRVRAWNISDSRPGFAALLLSAGYDVNALPRPAGVAKTPLARYVAWLRQDNQPPDDLRAKVGEVSPWLAQRSLPDLGDGLLHRLAEVQAIVRAWQQDGAPITDADAARGIKVIRQAKSPIFVWAIVVEALRIPDKKVTAKGGRAKLQRDVLEAACGALKDAPGLSYAARYELARHLAENGERGEARKRFAELYEETARSGALPPLDRAFRQALRASDKEPDLFDKLLRERSAALVKEGRRVAAVALAWQCWELEAPALADALLTAALDGIPERERSAPTLAAVEYLAQTHQYDRADQLLQGLLGDQEVAKDARLWRLGYQLALQRKQPARAFTCLAEALELEYRQMPEWIDVAAVRRDYGALLAHYADVVRATATLGQKPPADLAAKVVRAADRWRWLDVDGTAACSLAFQSLRGLGREDLAWDYLLMSAGADQPGFAWLTLAENLQQQEDFDLAERAYEQVCAAYPVTADLLRARADNLLRAGHVAEGRELLRQAVAAPAPPAPPPSKPDAPIERKER